MNLDLTEFQANLSKTMVSADTPDLYIALKEQYLQWVISLSDLKETSVSKNIAKLGIVKPWMLGVANFRGNICSVVDFKRLFDDSGTYVNYKNIITIVNDKYNLNTGFLWNDIYGLFGEDQIDKFKINQDFFSENQEVNTFLEENKEYIGERRQFISHVIRKKKDLDENNNQIVKYKNHGEDFDENGFWLTLDVEKMISSGFLTDIQKNKMI